MECDGRPYIKWIFDLFGECIGTVQEKASFGLGLTSTLLWMYAQLPQIWINFKRQNADGLSLYFLILLVVGDICNLIGAYINGGLLTQIITAIWFLFVDLCATSQYAYYTWILPRCKPGERLLNSTESQLSISAVPLFVATAAAAQLQSNPYDKDMIVGTLLGWLSFTAYFSSRQPQIWKNCRRHNTDGLSYQFFISAVLGNATYAASIFLKDTSWKYIWQQFPWLMGSVGLLPFDFIVLFQFLYYNHKNKQMETLYTGTSSINDVNDMPLYQ